MFLVEQFPALIVTISLLSAFTILIAGYINRKSSFFLSLATISFQLILSFFILYYVLTEGAIHYWFGGWRPPWGIEYVVDELNAFVLIVILFMTLLAVIYSKRSVEHEIARNKHVTFYTLLQLLVTGLCGVTLTGDLFNMYVFLEIASLPAYALIAIASRKALKASYNYLIMGSIGISFYLLGIGFLYSVTGSLNMGEIKLLLPLLYDNKAVQTAFIFMFIGLSIKAAFFPLHTWQPDAYTYAPSAVTVIISTAMAKVSIYALIRIIFSVFTVSFIANFMHVWTFISWLSAIAIIIASILAIAQFTLKRMLAYSSVSQIGYIMLGVTLFYTHYGLLGALMHILNHAVMKGCLFMAACGFIYKAGLWDIRDLAGLGKKMPYTCAAFTIAALSMIGIPPTAGFATKLYLILAALEARQFVFVAVILLSSLLNLVYFWRVIEAMYMKGGREESREKEEEEEKKEIPLSMLAPILILASLCIVIGILWLVRTPLPILEEAIRSMGVVR